CSAAGCQGAAWSRKPPERPAPPAPRLPGSTRELLVRQPRRAIRRIAKAPPLVLLVGLKVALEPLDVAVALEGKDVRRQAVEEETVVADDHRAASEVLDRVL